MRIICAMLIACVVPLAAGAQVPRDIEAGLKKIGQIVDPACTAKLYRPLMPKNDYSAYWPVGAAAPAKLTESLYPGVSIARDISFGPNPKDLLDIFSSEKGGGNRTVLIYIPGGAGNKIEQQVREANAFYDNIGRWAVKNGMVGVTMQRHPAEKWDDGGRDIARMIQWLQDNITKYKGTPDRMFIWAHSAGNIPLGVYIGHPELQGSKGPGVRGAIFMSGTPVPGLGGAPAPGALQGGGVSCGAGGPASAGGAISGPSAFSEATPRGPAPVAQDNLPGFKLTKVEVLLARAELDPGVQGGMAASDIALHDEMCKAGHCPAMLYLKDESHMSEVFSIDSADKTVSAPILAWIKKVK